MALRKLEGNSAGMGRRVLYPAVVALVGTLLLVFYANVLHAWIMNWGATPAEQAMALPGDEYPLDGTVYSTRAITVQAPADVVYQWLVQHGQDRAGFYSNTYLENMVGADIHNADVLRPEWQQRAVGDKVPMARPDIALGAAGEAIYLRLQTLEPGRRFTTVDGNNLPARWFLQPLDAGTTRVLVREMSFTAAMGPGFSFWVWDPMHFVMEQRMMRGLKERAEGLPLVPDWLVLVARLGWLAAGLATAAAFLAKRRWLPVGLLCALALAPSLHSTGDLDGFLAGFLALGLSVLGLAYFGRRWLVAYPLVAAAVLLVLLLAPDSWTAFGITFALGSVALAARLYLGRPASGIAPASQRQPSGAV